jgi:hypothetical protein
MTSCHHRRVHRPHDAGPALLRRPAPGARGQGARRIQPENQTLASITFQNYFRMYDKLAGMTGTASTEAEEFMRHLQAGSGRNSDQCADRSVSTRTTRSTARSRKSSQAIVKDIKDAQRARPAGPGRHHLDREIGNARRSPAQGWHVRFNVLNARYHEQEAYIVAQAGVPGAVTIATNMAGRGTDIQLGGNADMRIAQELGDMPEGLSATRRSRLSVPRSRHSRTRRWPPAASTFSPPSATKAAASTTSCVAAPAVRATLAAPSSSCRCKMT